MLPKREMSSRRPAPIPHPHDLFDILRARTGSAPVRHRPPRRQTCHAAFQHCQPPERPTRLADPARRPRRRRPAAPCGSERVTRIAMNLTDGSPVEFTSCHRCEHRTWEEQGTAQPPAPGARACWTRPARSDLGRPPTAACLRPGRRGAPIGSRRARPTRPHVADLSADRQGLRRPRASSPTSWTRSRRRARRGLRPGRRRPGRGRRRPRHAPVLAGLAAAFADGATSQGADVVEIGLASTDQLYYASGSLDLPGAMFTASHNPARYNGIKLCRAGAAPVGQDSGLDRVRDLAEHGVPAVRRHRRGPCARGTCSPATPTTCAALVDLSGNRRLRVVVDAGNGMGGHTVPTVLAGPAGRPGPDVLRARRHLPEPRGQPPRPGQPGRPAGPGRAPRAPTSGWPSTATPTAASSSTSAASPVSPSAVTALVAVRELARAPRAPR